MEIRALQATSLPKIVTCLVQAFSNYYIKMPTEVSYWKQRFKNARVDFSLSFGMFDKEKLVAFIINGVDKQYGQLTAFNTGTGVLEAYRGQALVDQLYNHAFPHFLQSNIHTCTLEVIQKNKRAIRVYKRIGFQVTKSLQCLEGNLLVDVKDISIKKIDFQEFIKKNYASTASNYSWDNNNQSIIESEKLYQTYIVKNKQKQNIGYFVLNQHSGYVAQLETFINDFRPILGAVNQLVDYIRINNVDSSRKEFLVQLQKAGLRPTIAQFEMHKTI